MACTENVTSPAYRLAGVAILFVDIILCTAILFTKMFPGDTLTADDRGWTVNCAQFSDVEIEDLKKKNGGNCMSRSSESHSAILNKMVNKWMEENIDEHNILKPEDIPIKARPHGFLRGVDMPDGHYAETNLMQTIETWQGVSGGYSNLDFGVRLRHGRLIAPRAGLYQIFSYIDFVAERKVKDVDAPKIEHKLFKFNILKEDQGEREVLQAGVTPCLTRNTWAEDDSVGSYSGAITHLQAGDELSVRVSHIHLLKGAQHNHYFGIHRLGP